MNTQFDYIAERLKYKEYIWKKIKSSLSKNSLVRYCYYLNNKQISGFEFLHWLQLKNNYLHSNYINKQKSFYGWDNEDVTI